MPENSHSDSQPSVASLVGGILEDGQKLVRQEVALARREVAETCDKAKTGVALLSSALAVCGVAGVLLGVTLAKFLQDFLLPNHEWLCFGIAGVLFALLGGALFYFGNRKISEVHFSLPQTAETLRDDVEAVYGLGTVFVLLLDLGALLGLILIVVGLVFALKTQSVKPS